MLRKWGFRLLIFFLGLWLLVVLGSRLPVEIFWFQEVGYLQVFLLRLVTKTTIWVFVVGITAVYLLVNLFFAERLKYPPPVTSQPLSSEFTRLLSPQSDPRNLARSFDPRRFPAIRLHWLLPLALGFSLLVGLMLAYYGEIAISYWNPAFSKTSLLVSDRFQLQTIWQLARQIFSQVWYLSLVLGIAIAILIYPRLSLRAIAIVMSLLFGQIIYQNWAKILQYLFRTAFNDTDPLFIKDTSFYIFSLPVLELLGLWLVGLFFYGLIAVTLTYLLSGDSLSQGFFPGFSPPQQRHLYGLGGALMVAVALSYLLSRYELLYSKRGVSYGASYTDVVAQLPAYNTLCALAVAIAFYFLWRTIFWRPKSPHRQLAFYGLGVYFLLALVGGLLVPNAVQYLVVQPNELQREQPYIRRTIASTRQAFDLEPIDTRNFNPQGQLTEADIKANDLTIRNIRLWDQRPLLETNRQLQQIRPYYRFPDADIDRYTLETEATSSRPAAPQQESSSPPQEITERRQVLIAARELDYSAVPQEAQTWVNRHLIYTHGFGFTLSPVNVVGPGGLPEYFVKDISGNSTALTTANQAIRNSIPIGQPRIYYGEITNNYVITGTKVRELDYPSGSDNVYHTYDGRGGISIGAIWRRWLFAAYLKDWQMAITRDFLPETKVLLRRNVKQRIQAIAPFLKYDSDPYLVVADANLDQKNQDYSTNQNYLYWIVDAYTTSHHYPYSDPNQDGINYIRNSVKVVVDAYNGTVNFYVADRHDPIITTWRKIFPKLFKPLSAMPKTLSKHIRYPVDYFNIQAERLMTYHMTDTQVFYNREDQWQIPNEIYGNQARPVEPYYLITSLPTNPFEEFLLLLPYTPKQRTNLIAWLAARSDGQNYGKLLLYVFPKERLVYGPEQIEARINQDPVISQQISLWNRQGSRAIQGNLLVIPIEQSLLYVEPIYLEATKNSLPTLVRVVVAYENRIVMAQTLEQALQAIFKPEVTPAPAIIRPVEEASPS
ncbi:MULTISPECIES: UPF0182 family protein [unclassified Tolypothrix]|uniref:UPF0182 family protein n=1 Tax=unclassified Tolypothrix TaxID=2649714 RepID=UPI0005EAAEF1|nr:MULTISPECIES: UPF0182 family protein [unclassified Tolypothrix]BAY92835.1 hypothetical protein NIES3275_48720 [Microchaete diplosiphon NIES-3275]EKF02916.1 hypothetical protein FDUTEX481_05718 [Tolypothrix sp. PCC 7601]MBE9087539.1 UPF0182 family protein [Tolypothrix sp. LEGE 11397]UYD26751.1 UPF0182 family protein [Tolypothrix sp. PCC 7712]UYD37391.1 UPF0182 family protein [Tolypothrix sp. PCC 7601]